MLAAGKPIVVAVNKVSCFVCFVSFVSFLYLCFLAVHRSETERFVSVFNLSLQNTASFLVFLLIFLFPTFVIRYYLSQILGPRMLYT